MTSYLDTHTPFSFLKSKPNRLNFVYYLPFLYLLNTGYTQNEIYCLALNIVLYKQIYLILNKIYIYIYNCLKQLL